MLVLPGGGYRTVGNGIAYAQWLNNLGISAYVLKYRLGSKGYHHPAELNDATRAMRIIRSNAEEWKVDPHRIGVMGSSAGGHLAASLLVYNNAGDPQSTDTIEQQSSRPDIGILLYPVITMEKFAHQGSKNQLLGPNPSEAVVKEMSVEQHVTSETAPTFIFHTAADQTVPVQNSLMFATALANAHVPFELHIYPEGGHGTGLGKKKGDPHYLHPYTFEMARWLKDRKFAR